MTEQSPAKLPFELPVSAPLPQQTGESFGHLVALMQRLLAEDGCPWDREQTKHSLRRFVLEEACEVIDAIDGGSDVDLCEELGDLALQVAFLGELGRRAGTFGPDDVMRGICEKLVRRHPHVFGDASADGAAGVERNWDRIKAEEKGPRSLLASIPRNLPALLRARQIGIKVASVGFDWPDAEGSRAKVDEELGELEAAFAEGPERTAEEFGDLLFALVNWSRHIGVDAELALRQASDKFTKRFAHVEGRVQQSGGWPQNREGKPTTGIPLATLDSYWNESKEQ
jgi:MazG family protein